MKNNRFFDHHESDQHLNDFANAHGHNSRMWYNVSPARNYRNTHISLLPPSRMQRYESKNQSSNCVNNSCRVRKLRRFIIGYRMLRQNCTCIALKTPFRDVNYVHVRVTNACWCCQDVSHWDIQAVEVIVDWLQNGPPPQHPDAAYYARKLL